MPILETHPAAHPDSVWSRADWLATHAFLGTLDLLPSLVQVVRRLEAATHTEVAKLGTNSLLRTLNAFKQAIFLCDVASRGWPVLHANDAMLEHLGMVSLALALPRAGPRKGQAWSLLHIGYQSSLW